MVMMGVVDAKDADGDERDEKTPHSISPFFGELPVQDTDSLNVKNALAGGVTDIDTWLMKLDINQLKELQEISNKGVSDQNIRKLSTLHPTFEKLEALVFEF